MRLMLKFTIPVEKGNQAKADGSMSQVIKDLIRLDAIDSLYILEKEKNELLRKKISQLEELTDIFQYYTSTAKLQMLKVSLFDFMQLNEFNPSLQGSDEGKHKG